MAGSLQLVRRSCEGVLGSLALAGALAAQTAVCSEQKISETAGGFGGVLDTFQVVVGASLRRF